MRFLFVSHSLPYPLTNGGNQRTALLLRALQELGEVDLLLMHGETPPDESVLSHLRQHYNLLACLPMPRRAERPGWQRLRPLHPRLVDRLAHHLGRDAIHYRKHERVASILDRAVANGSYDLIIGRYLKPSAMSGALDYTPIVLDVDDLDYELWRTRLEDPTAPALKRPFFRHHLRQLKRLVPRLLAQCERLWVSNELDLNELHPLPAKLLPNIPFVASGTPPPAPLPPHPHSRIILTVASYIQERNVEGVDHFVTEAWPRIHKHAPDAKFRIVGSHLSDALRARWGAVAGVEPVGFVKDLRQEYAACAFSVAPLFYGGGSNIKVLESLAFGRPCVVTPFVARGYHGTLHHKEALWVAADAPALAEACILLLTTPALTQSLAQHGTRLVTEHYSYEQFRKSVHDGVQEVLRASCGVRPRQPSSLPSTAGLTLAPTL